MANHIIENEELRVTVSDTGAELISAFDKTTGSERIWTGDPAVWNRHAPVLFPFVGKVNGGKYRIGDREYPMKTQHGFARDLEFTCTEKTRDSVTHRLASNGQTLSLYPYPFRFTVRHRIGTERQLFIEWTVENTGDAQMFYSVGGHPGFMMPEGVRKEDCCILFPGKDRLRYISTSPAGYALPEQKMLSLTGGGVRYQQDIPATWIFEDHQVNAVGIALPDGTPYVMMDCSQFPMLAVWANPQGPFICLEPWFGRTDDDGFTGTIDQKKAIETLESGETKRIAYSIRFC